MFLRPRGRTVRGGRAQEGLASAEASPREVAEAARLETPLPI